MQPHPLPDKSAEKRRRPRTGVCSVTLRKRSPADVIHRAVTAGLKSIEWASDVHVPPGDLELAGVIGRQTRAAGLAVASYGSDLRFPWSDPPGEQVHDIVATAVALGAPRIRIWAGPTPSGQTAPEERTRTTHAIATICQTASDAGLRVALEFHLGTLTDTADSTLQLLGDLGTDIASTYWQPRVEATDLEAIEDLKQLGDGVSTLHVFSWGARFERYALDAREQMWRAATLEAVRMANITDLLLEFLPDDDASLPTSEARILKGWLDDAMEKSIL